MDKITGKASGSKKPTVERNTKNSLCYTVNGTRHRLKNGNMHNGEDFFAGQTQFFAGIQDVFQEKLGKYGGKKTAIWAY